MKKNYFIGFSISGVVHGLVIVFCLVAFAMEAPAEKLIQVDFSNISINKPEEGGKQKGLETENAQKQEVPETHQEELVPDEPSEAPPSVPQIIEKEHKETVFPADLPKLERVKSEPKRPVKQTRKKKTAKHKEKSAPQALASQEGAGKKEGVGEGRSTGEEKGYSRADFNYLLLCIKRKLIYPEASRRNREEGSTRISFMVKRDGSVEQVSVVSSSGFDSLDRAAVDAVRRASPFPRGPAAAKVVIPINFKLRH